MNRAIGTPLPDGGDRGFVDAVDRSQSAMRARVVTDGADLIGREFAWFAAPMPQSVTPIASVAGVAPGVQMAWVDAGRNITGMADESAFGDWSDPMLVGEAMGVDELIANSELSIPTVGGLGSPQPAGGRVGDVADLRDEASTERMVHKAGD